MSRLTRKSESNPNRYVYDDIYCGKHIDKLGQLEDIEEELKIDLITLLKALNNGFYGKTFNGKIKHITQMNADILLAKDRIFTMEMGYEIEDEFLYKEYGIDWALTKEELL